METSLKSSLCSVQDLGATGNMDIREKYLPIFSFEQIRKINYMTRCQQAIMIWHRLFYNPTMVVIINRQVLHLQVGWISIEYLKTNIFVKSEHWRPTQMDALFTIFLLQANWLRSWSIELDFPEGGDDKDLRMIKCRLTRIFNPECSLSICSCVYVADQFNMDKSKLNWGLMSRIYPAA